MGVIFDLDQTLVDSAIAKSDRDARNWEKVYSLVPKIGPYAGVVELLDVLAKNEVPTAIVTTSPRPYCSRVMTQCKFKFASVVCYHDTMRRKPHPDPILKALELMRVDAKNTVSIGDDVKDIQAGKAAGVITVAAAWGIEGAEQLQQEKPDHLFTTVEELHDFLVKKFC